MSRPKIGIRPVIDGRWGGVREGRRKSRVCNRLYHNRRRSRGGKGCRAVRQRKRCCNAVCHAVLVLRQRNNGFRPQNNQSSVGI